MEYEVIVVGAGVQGSAAAYSLASRGTKNVLLLEQFDRLNIRGSSHGGSRITRRAYHKSIYVKMMDECFKMWTQIEKESGNQLYWRTGMYVVGEKGNSDVTAYIQPMEENGVAYEILSGAEVTERFTKQVNFPRDYLCVYERDSGILKASKAVEAMQELFIRHGGKLLDAHKVTGILPGAVVTVQTEKGDFRTKQLILAVGAWTNSLLDKAGIGLNLSIIPERVEVFYWKVEDPRLYSIAGFPVFAIYNSSGELCFNCPVFEYPGLMKICTHKNIIDEIDPDKRDASPYPVTLPLLRQFIDGHFRGVDMEPAIMELCIKSTTPDLDPFIDRHPQHPNIVIGAGFSGHGFKLSPLVGKMLGELALGQTPSYDLSTFKIGRFL